MILDEIAAKTALRMEKRQEEEPFVKVKEHACRIAENELNRNGRFTFPFEAAMKKQDISFICEVKRASPSKGLIAEDFPYLDIALEYEAAGAAAVSVLTEPCYFKGSDRYLAEISATVTIPALRKDFTVCPYMVYEAKLLGASAVLLICAILTDKQIKECLEAADCIGLSAVVEAHTEDEVKRAVGCGARIVGVNNRDLRTFDVDITTSLRLRPLVPSDVIFISESGIRTAEDINNLRMAGTDGVLIGETLMRSADKKRTLSGLRGE